MALKKQTFSDDEIAIFDDAVIYKRGEYWHFRMWLSNESKYARKSLKTRSKSVAIEKAKECYLEIFANAKANKKYFSITTKEGVALYLAERQKDVDVGLIVVGRHATLKTHLQHWLEFIGKDTKLKELNRNDCVDYFYERMKKSNNNVKQVTVQNEQSTINSLIKYLFKIGETAIDAFEFKKLPKLDNNNEAIRRATFTGKEYNRIYKYMRTYCARRKNKLDMDEWLMRQMIRHYILIAANSGLRVGEQMQLCWGDVSVEKRENNGEVKTLARINVRAATSKVRTSRSFLCRGGEYFVRLKKLVANSEDGNLIFSLDGKTKLTKRTILYHFHKIVELAGVEDSKERDLVPYSLRHFMITQRIMSGLSFRQIADMCGTSVAQIEKTYYHLNDEIRLTNAMADYKWNDDGTIRVV
jgi:site-specific recombinase XerD